MVVKGLPIFTQFIYSFIPIISIHFYRSYAALLLLQPAYATMQHTLD